MSAPICTTSTIVGLGKSKIEYISTTVRGWVKTILVKTGKKDKQNFLIINLSDNVIFTLICIKFLFYNYMSLELHHASHMFKQEMSEQLSLGSLSDNNTRHPLTT